VAAEVDRVRGLLASMLLETRHATYRSLQGWLTTRPSASTCSGTTGPSTPRAGGGVPFASADLAGTGGLLYGLNARGGGLVMWDRFTQPNYNAVVLARSGAGKSYFAKLELLRSLYRGIEVAVIDPEDEYRRLAVAVGGATSRSASPACGSTPSTSTRRGRCLHPAQSVRAHPGQAAGRP